MIQGSSIQGLWRYGFHGLGLAQGSRAQRHALKGSEVLGSSGALSKKNAPGQGTCRALLLRKVCGLNPSRSKPYTSLLHNLEH